MMNFALAGVAASRSRRLPPPPGPGFTPPYSLPSPGTSLAIGTNTCASIAPAGLSGSQFVYSWSNSFGGGIFNPYYSQGGAYFMACSGGHLHPDFTGAAGFDYQDATWKLHEHTNGGVRYGGSEADKGYNSSQTSGAPYWEISDATVGNVPVPPHPVQALSLMPPSMGGGAKGNLIYVTRGSLVQNGTNHSGAVHDFDLVTNRWRRTTNSFWSVIELGPTAGSTGYNTGIALDEPRKRYWVHAENAGNTYLYVPYVDASDATPANWLWKTDASYGSFQAATLSTGARVWMYLGRLFIQASHSGTNELRMFDPDNVAAAYQLCSVTGSFPGTWNRNKFEYYPRTGKFYFISQTGGGTLTRLTPPNTTGLSGSALSTALLSGWSIDTTTVTPALPRETTTGDGSDNSEHYTKLVYVPSIDRLSWLPGDANSVYLLDPT